jgi:HK97 family phage prohead protease
MAKYNAADLKTMSKNGEAMPDGSYPIGDGADLRKAISAVGRGAGSHNAIRMHIMKRAKALGLMDAIPENWMGDGSMKQTNSTQHPTDNLIRAMSGADALASDGRTLFGHFAVFNTPTVINDAYEGRFIEQLAPNAFDRTLKERAGQIKVLFNHGQDPSIGNKPIGEVRSLGPDKKGVAYSVDLFDETSYVRDLIPGLRAGVYGASFRFRAVADDWAAGERSESNPDGLDVRTVTDAELYEFGPVTFPAYPEATAGVRAMTGDFIDRLIRDPLFVARFTERAGLKVVEHMLETVPPTVPVAEPEVVAPVSSDGDEWEEARQRRIAYLDTRTAGFVAHLSRLKETS